MTFKELQELFEARGIVPYYINGGPQWYVRRAIPVDLEADKAVIEELSPVIKKHAWAIKKNLIGPMLITRLVGLLHSKRITVGKKGSHIILRGSPTASRNERAYWEQLLHPHVVHHLNELHNLYAIENYLEGMEKTPAEWREDTFRTMRERSIQDGSRFAWHSRYTRAGGYIDESLKQFPIDATDAYFEIREECSPPPWAAWKSWAEYIRDPMRPGPLPYPHEYYPELGTLIPFLAGSTWYVTKIAGHTILRGHYPPPGWKWPDGKPPPWPCLPPPGWSANSRDQRRQWFRNAWKTESTFSDPEDVYAS